MHRTSAEITWRTTRFLINKQLHTSETLFYESQSGGRETHVIYEETQAFPGWPVSCPTRFLNYLLVEHESLQPSIPRCPRHSEAFLPIESSPRLHSSSLLTSNAVHFRNRDAVWRVATEKYSSSWASLFLPVKRGGNGGRQGRKVSSKYLLNFGEFTRGEGMFAELETRDPGWGWGWGGDWKG